jgi:hypothetical protein
MAFPPRSCYNMPLHHFPEENRHAVAFPAPASDRPASSGFVSPSKGRGGLVELLGPDGGPVTVLASPVGSPNVIYAGVFGGVFKSVDGGATWKSASRGLDLMSAVETLAIDPFHPSILYAGTFVGPRSTETSKVGVFKSVDGGATWKPTGLGLVQFLAAGPSGAIYAAVQYDNVYENEDGGVTWVALGGTGTAVCP